MKAQTTLYSSAVDVTPVKQSVAYQDQQSTEEATNVDKSNADNELTIVEARDKFNVINHDQTINNVLDNEIPLARLSDASQSVMYNQHQSIIKDQQQSMTGGHSDTQRKTRNKRIDYKELAKGTWDLSHDARMAQEEAKAPKNLKEALSRSDTMQWIEAVENEMQSIVANEVYEIVSRPKCNVVGCRWVFVTKLMPDGSYKP